MRGNRLNPFQIAFLAIVITIVSVAGIWGLVTGSPEEGKNLYFKGIDMFVAQPIISFLKAIMESTLPK